MATDNFPSAGCHFVREPGIFACCPLTKMDQYDKWAVRHRPVEKAAGDCGWRRMRAFIMTK